MATYDEFWFSELDNPEISSGTTCIKTISATSRVEVNGIDVWELKIWDTIQVRGGKFYIQSEIFWIQAFSQYFGENDIFMWWSFIQKYELIHIDVEGQALTSNRWVQSALENQ